MPTLLQRIISKFVNSNTRLSIPVRETPYLNTITLPPTIHSMQIAPPNGNLEPHSITLNYRYSSAHGVTRDAFIFGQWCGEHGIKATLQTPGDGTLRIVFGDDTDMTMFKLALSEKLECRENNKIS